MKSISRRSFSAAVALAPLLATLRQAPRVAAQSATPVIDIPVPIEFPRDDGLHDTTVEWWYFTGNLQTEADERLGFEYVIFRARQGQLEGFVSHFAVTDPARERFTYDQRIIGRPGVVGDAAALDLDIEGWTMRGESGDFALRADMPGYAIDLSATTQKPPALHDGDGYIDYGNGTASYYYTWTRLAVTGTVAIDGAEQAVTGEAWMDHQWGDFATYQEGGWDWFSIQLDDDRDLMLYIIRGANGEFLRVDGTFVDPAGGATYLGPGDFTVTPTSEWTSPATNTTYPSGWDVEAPALELALAVTPLLLDQELDTRSTTGVIYWEGAVDVAGAIAGEEVAGHGYVELTGYAPFEPIGTPAALAATPAG
ncbi:MAG: lipocalin family protein [Thermomicrobiales bacterium]